VTAWIALAGLTPTGALLAAAVPRGVCPAVAWAGRRDGRDRGDRAALAGGRGRQRFAVPGRRAGVAAFAARAEPGLGTLGSLCRARRHLERAGRPDSRATLFAVIATRSC
jgi:hypothetical protein